jgi:uncharacterized alpha-E superfamily protein
LTLLSRTADNLFWLARYVERAESIARILDAAARLSALPSAYGGQETEWESAVATAGCTESFVAANPKLTRKAVIEWLAFSPENPSSIRRCFETARASARAERTALTYEMWDAINGSYLEMQSWCARRVSFSELPHFLSFVKEASLRFDGSAYRTMLRNDAYWFERLGVLVERADNTARILDVKYHVLLPDHALVGGGLDYYQWTAILRSVSALTSYRWIYRCGVKPWLVADLLILKDVMPRSLASCYQSISQHLDAISDAYGQQGPSQRRARALRARLRNARIESIFQSGLHEFVREFILENSGLGEAIADQYLS